MKALVWSVVTYGCESWTFRKNEARFDSFDMKKLRKILRISWTAKKTNEWVLNEARITKELLDTGKARKLAYCGQTRNIATDFDKTWGPAPSADAVPENGVN